MSSMESTEQIKCENPDCEQYGQVTEHAVRPLEGRGGFAAVCKTCGQENPRPGTDETQPATPYDEAGQPNTLTGYGDMHVAPRTTSRWRRFLGLSDKNAD